MPAENPQGIVHPADPFHEIADRYAAAVDDKPHHRDYERPATLALLPPLADLRVLDVGCGSGWYAEHLAERGARVTAMDVSPRFVALTRARVGGSATVLRADLARPLDFAPDAAFDLVLAPLVLHYVEDWPAMFAEFRRVLRQGGHLVFSTHHPFMDWTEFDVPDYFAVRLLEDDWEIGKVTFYRRPLSAMTEALAGAGFVIERMVEPRPTEGYRRADPEGYAKLSTKPWFLTVRARRHDPA